MNLTKVRRQIAWEAARLMYSREEAEYHRAKMKAARRVQIGWVRPSDLPSNAEIRDQVLILARLHEGAQPHADRLLQMRMRALWWMEHLKPFQPRLIGSVLTGHIREGSDIDLHVFCGSPQAVLHRVEETGAACEVERKRVLKEDVARVFTHVHIRDSFPIELTVYEPALLGHRFKSSITGKPIERATTDQLRKLVELEHHRSPQEQQSELDEMENAADRWQVFEALLWPLEKVSQSPTYHPEGDALYHSLQVYTLALDEAPYDEDFLLAALLHDVGKAIDPLDHVAAGLEALEGFISPRTAWLIAHHMEVRGIRENTIGVRRKRRLRESPWYEDLLALGDCDFGGRVPGVQVEDVDVVLSYIRSIETMFG